jgi:hypothetical protein
MCGEWAVTGALPALPQHPNIREYHPVTIESMKSEKTAQQLLLTKRRHFKELHRIFQQEENE